MRRKSIITVLFVLILPLSIFSQYYPIKWEPDCVELTIGNGLGATEPASVYFKSEVDLSDINVWITPEIRPFVKINPNFFQALIANIDYKIVLNFTIPPGTIEGLYEGTIHLMEHHRTVAIPLKVNINIDFGENYIPPSTKVISDFSLQYLTDISEGGTVLTFSQTTPELNDLTTGDIIVLGISENTPYGFLARVDFVSQSSGEVKIHISSATLEDAIYDGDIILSKTLSPVNAALAASHAKGIHLMRSAQLQESDLFYINFDNVVLFDLDGNSSTTYDQVKANGDISFSSHFDFVVKIRDFKIKEFLFKNTLTEMANLAISADIAVSLFDKKIEVAKIPMPSIKIMVGHLPVWVTPVITVDVGLNGEVSINVSSDLKQQASLETGLGYENGQWYPISEFSNQYDFNPPTLSAECNFQGHVTPQLALMVYGILGVYGAVDGHLELNAQLTSLCLITIEFWGGINVGIGVKVEILSRTLADEYAEVVTIRDLLFASEIHICPHTISNPLTPVGPINGVVNKSYTYTTGGSTCSYGHNIEYQFDWGDTTLSNWSSSTSASHLWPVPGVYSVKARARCAENHLKVSLWSSCIFVQISSSYSGFIYGFNEGTGLMFYDEMGSGNNGTLYNGVNWVASDIRDNNGNPGHALEFDGVNDYARLFSHPFMDAPFTIMLWAKKLGAGYGAWVQLIRANMPGTHQGYNIYWFNNNLIDARIRTQAGRGDATYYAAENIWLHVAATYDLSKLKLYINGSLVDETSITGSLISPNWPFSIGGQGGGIDDSYFNGIIDGLKIFAVALDASEINNIYQAETPIK